ncbi:formate dehydrogenase accessory sulfurtransferase FdhD [Virgibacillus doumboii]|uniref:formate dehydrogenase accessory sulfurtransferase FdhD n=1 Tax=Virgibacillus doumboii TaxID=2697503 RepID=UPI0013E08872|nr:formate dehydrogenase accessory sulfurtransferase FdhD [Virgibacillus doumboii]
MNDESLLRWQTAKYHHHLKMNEEDEIARESAVTVMINEEQYATIVCTPNNIREMAFGFLASEGIIRSPKQVEKISVDMAKGFVYVDLVGPVEFSERTERWIGSCCGKSREFYLKQDVKTAKTIYSNMMISTQQIYELMKKFERNAEVHGRTGGVHQAALATADELIASYIDIGRHNALDKLYGYILQNRIFLKDKIILFSGRISSEVILKVSKIGAGILIAKSAPTDLALRLADDLQITAIGFVRENSLNVYTHENRVYGDARKDFHYSN